MDMSAETKSHLEDTVAELQKAMQQDTVRGGIPGVAAAAVSATFTVGPSGGHLQGWITYLDGKYGKIHFKSTNVTHKSGLFAGVFAFPALPVAMPDLILGQNGRCKVNGSWTSGVVTLFAGSTLIGAFSIAGSGAFGWSFDADVDFTKG